MPGGPSNTYTETSTKVDALTTGEIEETDFDGRPAVWIEGHTLMWADGNTSYQVGGLDLEIEQAKAIARSLK